MTERSRGAGCLLALLAAAATGCGDSDSDPGGGGGPILWERRLGGPLEDTARGIAVVRRDELYLVREEARGPIDRDVLVTQLDAGGTVVWETRWGDELPQRGNGIASDGEIVVIAGSTQRSLGIGSADAALVAFDARTGKLRWELVTDGGDGQDELHGVSLEPDGIFAAGWTTSDFTGHDLFVQCVDYEGKELWARAAGGELNDEGLAAPAAVGGLVYVAGRADVGPSGEGGDALLAAFSRTNGAPVWEVLGGRDRAEAALGLTTDGFDLYLAGIRRPRIGAGQVVVWGFDLAGTPRFRTEWGGADDDAARGIAIDQRQGGLVVAGTTRRAGRSYDLALLRFTATGELDDSLFYGGPGIDEGLAVASDLPGIFVAGRTTTATAGGSDGWLLHATGDRWAAPPDSAAGRSRSPASGVIVCPDR